MRRLMDLHIHTNFSDGILPPKEIIDRAAKNKVSVISITDHDSIDAYSEELFEYAKSKNVELIVGVEISTKISKAGVHVLAYGIDYKNLELKEELLKIRNSRHVYLYEVNEKLKELGYTINVAELDKIDSVTKGHIALDVVNNPENKELLLKEFGHIPNKGEFIETIMNEGCPGFVKKDSMDPKTAVKFIKKIGGKAVLAHPVAYEHQNKLTEQDIRKMIEESNFDGIEANYIYIDYNRNRIDDIEKWNSIANEYNLFTTIGSDFHNGENNHPDIGLEKENLKLSNEDIEKIVNNLRK